MTVVFPKSEKRTQWEKTFNEVKLKITAALDHHPIPEFIGKLARCMRAKMWFENVQVFIECQLNQIELLQTKCRFGRLVLDYSSRVRRQRLALKRMCGFAIVTVTWAKCVYWAYHPNRPSRHATVCAMRAYCVWLRCPHLIELNWTTVSLRWVAMRRHRRHVENHMEIQI